MVLQISKTDHKGQKTKEIYRKVKHWQLGNWRAGFYALKEQYRAASLVQLKGKQQILIAKF